MKTFSKIQSRTIPFFLISLLTITLHAQIPKLKHSYTFDDGTPKDLINGADGILHGAVIQDGFLVASENGQYLELPADEINISSYTALTLEAFIENSKGNGVYTMFAYFGDITGDYGCDYLFQSLFNGGGSKTSITCKNSSQPWTTETSIRGALVQDDKPHHVVTTFDNKYLKFYIDGILVGVDSISQFPDNNIANLGEQEAWLCKGGYGSDPTWIGSIDKYNIYEGILESNTIAQSAQDYIPNLDFNKVAKSLKGPSSTVVVDNSGKFEQTLTKEHVFFVELTAHEDDGNNYVDEVLTFSDVPMDEWGDFSCAIRLSNFSGYLDVWHQNGHCFNNETRKLLEIGQVYQCWIKLNVPENTYSLYAKTVDEKQPDLIWSNAKFRKKVTELKYWSSVHNSEYQNDAMKVNALAPIDKIGDFPENYKASVPRIKKSNLDQKFSKRTFIVEDPQHGALSGYIEVKRLVLTDNTTNMFLRIYHSPTASVQIPEDTYIQPSGSKEKLYIIDCKGIPMSTQYYSTATGFTDAQLVFPAINTNTTSFTYKEENGNWFVHDIQLKSAPGPNNNVLFGNWFNVNTGDWEFTLLDTLVIYRNDVWKYSGFDQMKKKGTITLNNNNKTLNLIYKRKGKQLFIGEKTDNLSTLDQDSHYNSVENPINPPIFKKPILKPDTAILKGYCYGFSKEMPNKTATLYVDNIITGDQANHLIKIEDDGTFFVKLPTNHPQDIHIRMKGNTPRLFIEPGKEIFVLLNLKGNHKPMVMGANARLMTELKNYGWNNYYMNRFYQEIKDLILDMSPEEYKFFCMMKKEDDLQTLERLVKKHNLSDKYNQKVKQDIIGYYYRNVLHYHYTSQNAYRQKHNIPRNQRNLPVSFKEPSDPGFYNFLTSEYVNDEISLLGNSFGNLINAFKYSTVLRSDIDYLEYIKLMDGIRELDDDEKKLVEEVKHNISKEFTKLKKNYLNATGDMERFITKKYHEVLDEIVPEDPNELPILTLAKYLLENDTISTQEREYCLLATKYFSNPVVANALTFKRINQKALINLFTKYSELSQIDNRNKILEEQLNIPNGLVSDICTSQDILYKVTSQLTPLENGLIDIYNTKILHPEVKAYMKKTNEAVLAAIETNKTKGGYTLNEVPETEADRIFDTIISKYIGKVVYVDFWATWCGPCRSSMKNQAPMKVSLKDKDVVFVYITNPSSPEGTYKNMIPNIKGEHYRVSQDEWNYLTNKFKVSGIPHYLIVNKKGEVVDYDAPRDPSVLLGKFNELLKD